MTEFSLLQKSLQKHYKKEKFSYDQKVSNSNSDWFLMSFCFSEIPKSPSETSLFPNTYFLDNMDKLYRRSYTLHEEPNGVQNGNGIHH